MKTVNAGLISLAVAAVIIVLAIQHQTRSQWRKDNQSLRQQIVELSLDNQTLSNRLAATGQTKALTDEQMDELLKLRSEIGMLRQQTNQIGVLQGKLDSLKRGGPLPRTNIPSEEEQQEMTMHKMDDAHQAGLSFHMFADDNNNDFPTNFDQVARYIGNTNYARILSNEFQIVYTGSLTNIANVSSAIVVQEREAWPTYDGKWAKVYGFADGHSQLVTEPDGNFADFEQQHQPQPIQNQ